MLHVLFEGGHEGGHEPAIAIRGVAHLLQRLVENLHPRILEGALDTSLADPSLCRVSQEEDAKVLAAEREPFVCRPNKRA